MVLANFGATGRRYISICEPDVVELDTAGALGLRSHRRRNYFHRSIEQLEDALAGCHGGLQNVVFLAEVHDGTEKALRVLHEGDQNAQ